MIQVGERFASEVTLTPAGVADFAKRAGDENPVHHDVAYARSSRFGRLIASGTQTTSLLLGLSATHFSKVGAMLGLEFSFRFRRPVFADERIRLEWLIVRVRASEKLGGEIVELRGRIQGQDGATAVGAKGAVLVLPAL